MQSTLEVTDLDTLTLRVLEKDNSLLAQTLSGSEATAVVSVLKERVDRLRWHDNAEALRWAEAIIRIGEQGNNQRHVALGLMSLGDTIAITGKQPQAAWSYQERAAALYRQVGDDVGWARTVIGRVAICIEVDRVEATMVAAREAGNVFRQYAEFDLFVRLAINLMKVFNVLGRFQETIRVFEETLPVALGLEAAGEQHLGLLYNNVGNAYLYRGEYYRAREYFELAGAVLTKLELLSARRVVNMNIAYIEQAHGQYQRALHVMHQVLADYGDEQSSYHVQAKMYMVECYLRLNKYDEARTLADEVVADLARLPEPYPSDRAHSLRYLAEAEANLGCLEEAQRHLSEAEALYTALEAETWRQMVARCAAAWRSSKGMTRQR
jgi:tetratricopeptide (TPR) repeat protein